MKPMANTQGLVELGQIKFHERPERVQLAVRFGNQG